MKSMKPLKILPSDAPKVHQLLLQGWLDTKKIRAPRRSDFDFDNLHSHSHEAFEVVAAAGAAECTEFRFGRVSPEAERRYGRRISGDRLEDVLDPKVFSAATAQYLKAIESEKPHYWEKYSSLYGGEPQHYKRLLLPLVNDDNEKGWLLSSMVWPFHDDF